MFGRMMVEPLTQINPGIGVDLQTAVAALLKVTENVEIVRWIEFPASVLLFLFVPGDAASAAVYVLDRKNWNLVRHGLRGRTIRRVQRKPTRNASEGLQLSRSH
ncbi:MAG TPA: hypothetical protein VF783_02400 [Terriglobales bacterium]